jgi:hypothetical protein
MDGEKREGREKRGRKSSQVTDSFVLYEIPIFAENMNK